MTKATFLPAQNCKHASNLEATLGKGVARISSQFKNCRGRRARGPSSVWGSRRRDDPIGKAWVGGKAVIVGIQAGMSGKATFDSGWFASRRRILGTSPAQQAISLRLLGGARQRSAAHINA